MLRALIFLSMIISAFGEEHSSSIISMENDPSTLVEGKVNVITGDLVAFEEDLVIQGSEPVRISRSYIGSPKTSGIKSYWTLFEIEAQAYQLDSKNWLIYERNGAPIVYHKTKKFTDGNPDCPRYEPKNLGEGFSNTSQGKISSRTNLKNNYIVFDRKFKFLTVHCADGTIRTYKKLRNSEPLKFRLLEEKLPNGNWVIYGYERKTEEKEDFLLTSIHTTNPSKEKIYAKADILHTDPKNKDKSFTILGSDGQRVEYRHHEDVKGRQQGALCKVISSQAPDRQFFYTTYETEFKQFKGNVTAQKEHRLSSISLPLNRTLHIDYYKKEKEKVADLTIKMEDAFLGPNWFACDPRRSRVKTLSAPVGFSNKSTHSFIYDPKNQKTLVIDIDGNKTDYTWTSDFRLKRIERASKEGTLLNFEEFTWGYHNECYGNLISKSFFDADETLISSKWYIYDARGNVLEEKFFGNLSGLGAPTTLTGFNELPQEGESITRRFKYTASEPNLLLEEKEESGLRVVYAYLDATDLPISELIYDHEQLKIRKFWEYDDDNILIKEIVDDGSSEEKYNFTDIRTRTIRQITQVSSGPYVGMPKIIEEKYWKNGIEILLKKVVLTYTTGGRIEHRDHYDANGQFCYRLTTTYDDKGRLKSQTNALGQIQTFSYDLCGNQIESTNVSGRLTTSTEYDHSNQAISTKQRGDDGILLTSQFSYDNKHHLIRETDSRDVETRYVYDRLGRQIESHLPEVHTIIRRQYNGAGHEILKIDGEGNPTKTTYNAYGKPILLIHPDGVREEYIYNLDGSLKTYIDPIGIQTTYAYDYLGRVVRKTTEKATETWEYYGTHLTSKTDAEGNRTVYSYDGAGRKIGEEFGSEKTSYTYDALGRVNKIQKGDLCSVTDYDLLDRIVEERKELTNGTILRKTAYEYDEAGNQQTIIKWVLGNQTKEQFVYDSLHRMIEKTDPLGAVETTSFNEGFVNEFGQKVLQKTHVDPMGLKTIETFDTRGRSALLEKKKESLLSQERKYPNKNGKVVRQVNTIFPQNRTMETNWEYDSRGRITALIEAGSKTTKYSYTRRGELATKTKPDGTIVFYTYDDHGFHTSLSASNGTINHQMYYNRIGHLIWTDGICRKSDPHGRVLAERFPYGYCIANRYDATGRRIECHVPEANCLIEYAYNGGDLKQVIRNTNHGTPLYTHTYGERDLSGNHLQEESIRGTIEYSVDLLSRRTSINTPSFAQKILEFDPAGNIRKMQIQEDEIVYTYDDLYQLTFESGYNYAYDSLYNRLQKNNESYEVNQLNQDVSHFEYDLNGNPTRQGDTKYTYDALDRLVRIQTPTLLQAFTYDSLHRCITKSTYQNGVHEVRYFLYDGQKEIGSFDDRLNTIELRILGQTPHAEIGAAIAIELRGEIYAPIQDLQGNVAALIPTSDEAPTFYRYTAFGEEMITGTAPNPWRFSSKRTDDGTGLVHYGRRFYIPTFGRWLTPDPAGFSDGMNLYAFLRNDPLTHGDEYGLVTFAHGQGWQNDPWGSPFSYSSHPSIRSSVPENWNRSQVACRQIPALDLHYKRSPHYYVNGILNSPSDCRIGAQILQRSLGGEANVIPIYSKSWGFLNDMKTVFQRKSSDYANFASWKLNRELRSSSLHMDALNDSRKIFVTAFSRGAADAYHAIKTLNPDQKNRLIATTCGPVMMIPRDFGFSVTNLVSEGDWCSMSCNRGLATNPHKFDDIADVVVLPQIDGFCSFIKDHFFLSETYQQGIDKVTTPKYKEHGGPR